MQKTQRDIIAVVGPTAVGKTALGESIARSLNGEVVSADSMQVYRGMDIGTAKPPLFARSVPYHCLDLAEPGEPYSAARFQADARAALADIAARGRQPIVVGGTGLYVRAALDDMRFPAGDIQTAGRQRIDAMARDLGAAGLHALLAERDPASAALIHPNNTRRVMRALEMSESGVSYATQAAGFARRDAFLPTVYLGLSMERSVLYERIDRRVDEMVRIGLVAEVAGLLDAGYRSAVTATQAIGYKELVPVIEDGAPLATAVDDIKRASRRYAKRQLSWFRADPRVVWIDVTDRRGDDLLASALELIESHQRQQIERTTP